MKYFRYSVFILLLLLTVFYLFQDDLNTYFRLPLGIWLVLFITALVLLYRSRVHRYIIILSLFITIFSMVRSCSANSTLDTSTEIENSDYKLVATAGAYDIIQESYFYTKKIAHKKSSFFFTKNSKDGLKPAFLFKIRKIKEDEENIIISISVDDKTIKIDTLSKN